jgi:phosphopantothenoylcysteine decarboxylase/phosphopantothenate--cysteine ligase
MKIALGVTGCVGAYKAALILRHLQDLGADVVVVMTRHATEFVQPLTFQALSGHPVTVDMFAPSTRDDIYHITLAQEIDLLLIAPATANILAKFAHGIADDFLTTLYISTPAPVLLAPAMNVEMWQHPATQHNVGLLQSRGHHFVEPSSGYLACGMTGAGRLADPLTIAQRAVALITTPDTPSKPPTSSLIQSAVPTAATPIVTASNDLTTNSNNTLDLHNEQVLITAGPTREYLDPVRFLTNRSSGKMGYALAIAAAAHGAKVTLISGPVTLPPPENVTLVPVTTAAEMHQAVMEHFSTATIIIKSAAVADYRPQTVAPEKIKKNAANLTLQLEKTVDILAALGQQKGDRVLVGFAAETNDVAHYAQQKLMAKNLDLIVANDVSASDAGFDSDNNRVLLIDRNGHQRQLPLQSKQALAEEIWQHIVQLKTTLK